MAFAEFVRFIRVGMLFVATAALAGCASLSSNVVVNDGDMDAAYAADHNLPHLVDKLAQPLVDSGKDIGIVVAVLDQDGNKHVYTYGKKWDDFDDAPDGRTIFAVGSVTKSFVSVLLHDLVKDGTIDLNDTVGHILGDRVPLSEAARRITLSQLVNHTSGLPRQPNDFETFTSLVHYLFTGDNIYSDIDTARIYKLLATFEPDPDSVGNYRYSNIGMGILGRLIEIKTGKPLAVLLKQRILDPLGLKDTTYDLDEEQYSRLATGHVGDSPFFVKRNTPLALWDTDDILKGAAGLYSTADDLLKFAQYRLRITDIPMEDHVVDASGLLGMFKTRQYISFGWNVDEFDGGAIKIIYQHGIIAGYSAYIGIEPEKKLAVVALYNNFNWDDQIGHNLLLVLSRHSGPAGIHGNVAEKHAGVSVQ